MSDVFRYAKKAPPRDPNGRKRRKASQREIKRGLWPKGRKTIICQWCPAELTFDSATVDHVIALDRGGTNGSNNLCLACTNCNQRRGNRVTPAEAQLVTRKKEPRSWDKEERRMAKERAR